MPAAHTEQTDDPDAACVPSEHVEQSAGSSWSKDDVPASLRNFPARHAVHTLEPAESENVPGPHTTQPNPFDEKYPTGQGEQAFEEKHEVPNAHDDKDGQVKQSSDESCNEADVAVSTRYFPAAQTVQTADPVFAAYVPTGHIEQRVGLS